MTDVISTPDSGDAVGHWLSQVLGVATESRFACTPLCYRQLHVDDFVGWFGTGQGSELNGMADERSLSWAANLLESDGGGSPRVVLVQQALDPMLDIREAARKIREEAGKKGIPSKNANLQVLRVWYYREKH